jgi:hypothetical protein
MDHTRASVLPERLEETPSLVYLACALLLSVETPVTRCGGTWLAQGRCSIWSSPFCAVE